MGQSPLEEQRQTAIDEDLQQLRPSNQEPMKPRALSCQCVLTLSLQHVVLVEVVLLELWD